MLRNDLISRNTDEALVRACRKGDARAWRRLVKKYERLVYSIPLSYGLSHDDAADITQITFTVLSESLDSVRDESRLTAWLATVAKRHTWRLLDRNRLESASEHLDDVELAENTALLCNSDADSIEYWELIEWLDAGLSKMKKPCRDLLLALYFHPEQPSYAQIAASLGVAVGSIGPTRARCLQSLRKMLEEG
jgi:RNA polymerase sigma factor (sigma-70 family)